MRTIVVGCGQLGATLAHQLFKQGHLVVVVDRDVASFDRLPGDFQGLLIEGDILVRNVLQRAQIEEAEALIAVTESDATNALVAFIAKSEYNVPRVIAGNRDPHQRVIQESFGIPVVGSASWGTQQFVELLSDIPLRTLHFNSDPSFVICQLQIPESWHGRSADELPVSRDQIVDLTRRGASVPLSSLGALEAGDLVYLKASPAEIDTLKLQFAG